MMERSIDRSALPKLVRQFVLFVGAGAVGTAAHYLVMILLVEWGGIPPVTGSGCGFAAGALVNYHLARRFVFLSDRPHREALVRFLATAFGGFWVNLGVMHLLLQWTPLHYLLAQLIATGVATVWNFSVNRCWTFAVRDPLWSSAQEAGSAADRRRDR